MTYIQKVAQIGYVKFHNNLSIQMMRLGLMGKLLFT